MLDKIAKSTSVRLHVLTSDAVAEVFIIDSHFQRVDQGVGQKLTFFLPRGLYAVKVRVGSETEEKAVILSQEETLVFAPLLFASPAPLSGTRLTHSTHMAQAEAQSREVHLGLGNGSQLYIFVRDWVDIQGDEVLTEDEHPAMGLSLQDEQNHQLVDFSDRRFPHQIGPRGWSACNIAIKPGTYILCLKQATGDVIQQTLVTSLGWQTQLFLVLKDHDNADKRADLVNASIFMTKIGTGFYANDQVADGYGSSSSRLTEMVRLGLVNDRQIVSNKFVNQLLDTQLTNPMLGLFSAHLLLQTEPLLLDTLQKLVATLRKLVGNHHPDIETLAVKLGLKSKFIFQVPPMLRQSWSLLLNATIDEPRLVNEASLICQITDRLVAGAPWLLWVGEQNAQKRYESNNRQLQIILDSLNSHKDVNRIIDLLTNYLEENQIDIRNSIANDSTLVKLTKRLIKILDILPIIPDKELRQLVFSLGVPRAKVEILLNDYNAYLLYSNLKQFALDDSSAFEKLYHWFRLYYLPFSAHKKNVNQLKARLCAWLEIENFFGNNPYVLLLYAELAAGIRPPLAGFLKLICECSGEPFVNSNEFRDYRRKSLAHWLRITNQNPHFIDLFVSDDSSSFYENMNWKPAGAVLGRAIDIVTSPQDITLTTHFNNNSFLEKEQNVAWADNEIQSSSKYLEVYEELLVILSIATNDARATKLQRYSPELFNKFQEIQL